ncbi:class E sortase [Spongiactinospora sp. 9N601]|uniref:class E sortase n=1 Tax=Spongiactinospora sp. 9N601 TaxID=3375149 RepID=UPI00379FAA82
MTGTAEHATAVQEDRQVWTPRHLRIARAAGEIMLTCGVLLVLFAGYATYGKAWRIDREQGELDTVLDRSWAAGDAVPAPGRPMARLHIPRLDRRWAVTEGVTQADLRKGPGHYPRTARPGEIGNVGVAGHRIASVFWDLDRLRAGDPIVAETKTGWYVYRVVGRRVVLPTSVEVVAPNPDRPREPPTKAMLTLTTCTPKFQNRQRLIVHAELAETRAKSAGRPAALGGERA